VTGAEKGLVGNVNCSFRLKAVGLCNAVKPLRNAVQPLSNVMQRSMKHPVTPEPLCFRRFLLLCNQCNRVSRCGRDAESAGRHFQRECGGQPVPTGMPGHASGYIRNKQFIHGGPGLEQPGHEQADKLPQTDLWSVRVQFVG
jgi:hypothetical protein